MGEGYVGLATCRLAAVGWGCFLRQTPRVGRNHPHPTPTRPCSAEPSLRILPPSRGKRGRLACILALLLPTPALAAPPVIISAAPDTVAVTLYRDPNRGEGEIYRDNPSSFALIAETRTVTLPPGEVTVRFEGVASGIVPKSAILFGVPPRERNRDALLLSQGGLVDAFTGQSVILRRTDPATGKQVEERATIRSAANRLVVETPRGVEAVYCSGLSQTLIYPEVPAGLSAKPVLSMTTKPQGGGKVTITLAYIATGFDWDATYVATLAPDGQSMALFAWLTMASGDDTSFIDATTAAVAGKVNRSNETRDDTGRIAKQEAASLNRSYNCWPAGTTSDIYAPPPPPPAPGMMMEMDMVGNEIVVTSMRRELKAGMAMAPASVVAKVENLGDLKLYRIPVVVTVAARSQKQVAFLQKPKIDGTLLYRARVDYDEPGEPQMMFRFRNRKKDGAGDPLPAGKAVFYQEASMGRMVVGEGSIPDKALDEEVEMVFGEPSNVTQRTETSEPTSGDWRDHTVTLSNANPFPVRYEIDFMTNRNRKFTGLPGNVIAKPGKRVWAVTIAANGTQKLTYRAADVEEE
jgi:hypothetical protein